MSHYIGSVPATKRAPDWPDTAACRDQDPELFFPAGDSGPYLGQIAEAKAFCGRCPVRDVCLNYALDNRIDSGIFGGLTEQERRSIRRRRTRETHPRTPQTEPSNKPAPTLTEAFQRRTVPLDGGHLAWTGTRTVTFRGVFYTPKRAAFITDRGRDPQGLVLPVCGVDECVLPAHLADGQERDARDLCGSRTGYRRHLRNDEEPCGPCRQANTDADNRLRRTGTTKVAA